jgi:hypothetical protein
LELRLVVSKPISWRRQSRVAVLGVSLCMRGLREFGCTDSKPRFNHISDLLASGYALRSPP